MALLHRAFVSAAKGCGVLLVWRAGDRIMLLLSIVGDKDLAWWEIGS